MDKEYALLTLRERIEILKERYRLACHGLNEYGVELKKGVADTYRTGYKREMQLCMLVEELVSQIKSDEIPLSNDAENGLEKLMEPNERHRNCKAC